MEESNCLGDTSASHGDESLVLCSHADCGQLGESLTRPIYYVCGRYEPVIPTAHSLRYTCSYVFDQTLSIYVHV